MAENIKRLLAKVVTNGSRTHYTFDVSLHALHALERTRRQIRKLSLGTFRAVAKGKTTRIGEASRVVLFDQICAPCSRRKEIVASLSRKASVPPGCVVDHAPARLPQRRQVSRSAPRTY